MAYSKEVERQNQVLGDILTGKEPEKRIMVGYKGKKEEKGDIGLSAQEREEIFQELKEGK